MSTHEERIRAESLDYEELQLVMGLSRLEEERLALAEQATLVEKGQKKSKFVVASLD